MEEHEKALNLLTHKLRDYNAAEEYCKTHSQVVPQTTHLHTHTTPSHALNVHVHTEI